MFCIMMEMVELTLSARTEGTSRHFVPQLTTFLAAELLPLFAGKQSLIFVHLFLVLLHTSDVGKEVIRIVLGNGRDMVVLAHPTEKTRDTLLGVRVSLMRGGPLLAFALLL